MVFLFQVLSHPPQSVISDDVLRRIFEHPARQVQLAEVLKLTSTQLSSR